MTWRITLVCVLFFLAGCSLLSKQTEPLYDSSDMHVYIEHRVSYAGETPGLIVAWYTGDRSLWSVIKDKELNVEIEETKLQIGDSLFIPEEYLITKEPLPEWIVKRNLQRQAAAADNSRPSNIEVSTIEEFFLLNQESQDEDFHKKRDQILENLIE